MNIFIYGSMKGICRKIGGLSAAFILGMSFFPREISAFPANASPSDAVTLSKGTAGEASGDSIIQFNQFGSYGLFIDGIRAATGINTSRLMTSYSYRNFDGYRVHSSDYSHNVDLKFESAPSANTTFQVMGHYIDGQTRRPGSLTKKEFDSACFQADPRAINRDEKRVTQKGQAEVKYEARFGKSLNQKIEVSGNGQIEYFERVTNEFKITTRYVAGLTARYVCHFRMWDRTNEFSIGGNLLYQPERKEEYDNMAGQKSDNLEQIEVEKTSSSSCHVAGNFELVERKLFLVLKGRYDHVVYSVAEESLPARSDTKHYQAVTPEIGLNYKILHGITLFASWEMNFKNPTDKELESFYPDVLYNQDLKPQTSSTLKTGIKGVLEKKGTTSAFTSLHFDATLFSSRIDHEIVRYEIYGDEFYRNATLTNRLGFTLHGSLEFFRALSCSVSYTFSDYLYKTYTARSLEADQAGTILAVNRDFSGHAEPNIPRNNLNLALAYRHPLGKNCGISAKVSYSALSGIWVDDLNSDKTGSYNLFNTLLGFDVKAGHFALKITGGVNNIFNQVYVGNSNINSADRRFYDAGSPRDLVGSVNLGYFF